VFNRVLSVFLKVINNAYSSRAKLNINRNDNDFYLQTRMIRIYKQE